MRNRYSERQSTAVVALLLAVGALSAWLLVSERDSRPVSLQNGAGATATADFFYWGTGTPPSGATATFAAYPAPAVVLPPLDWWQPVTTTHEVIAAHVLRSLEMYPNGNEAVGPFALVESMDASQELVDSLVWGGLASPSPGDSFVIVVTSGTFYRLGHGPSPYRITVLTRRGGIERQIDSSWGLTETIQVQRENASSP